MNNCVLMDGVQLEDGCGCNIINGWLVWGRVKLDSCIICDHAVIEKNSTLTKCRIGYQERVAAESSMKDEVYPMLEM